MKVKNIEFERIYLKLARKHNTSSQKIKSEIQKAIDAMWESNKPNSRALFPNGKPSIEEFFTAIKKQLIWFDFIKIQSGYIGRRSIKQRRENDVQV